MRRDLADKFVAETFFTHVGRQGTSTFGGRVKPIFSEQIVFGPELILVDVSVLDDQGRDSFRRLQGQAQSDLGSIIVQVQRIPIHPQLLREIAEKGGVAVESANL